MLERPGQDTLRGLESPREHERLDRLRRALDVDRVRRGGEVPGRPVWEHELSLVEVEAALQCVVGDCDAGPEMHFSFYDLIAHIAKTRRFTAGTILGSGTVSNADRARGVSCLAERRMIETIETGKPSTPFMVVGDRIEIEAIDASGASPFGRIDQRVVGGGS